MWSHVVLLPLSVLSGFLCATAGGAGLVLFPALLLLLDDPLSAIAVSKIAVYAGSMPMAFARYRRAGLIHIRGFATFAVAYGLGFISGQTVHSILTSATIYMTSSIVLVGLVLVAANKERWLVSARFLSGVHACSGGSRLLRGLGGAVLGVYSASFPGSGLLIVAVILLLYDVDQLGAVANKAFVQLAGMSVPMVVFVSWYDVEWSLVPVLVLGELLGSFLGVRWAIGRRGMSLKAIYYLMVTAMSGMLFVKAIGTLG